ncbi:hypothetical protein [Ktedonospora formicarum]|uniref:hypothetical protein n=1 Tax=Ktedonospora formicarum TaxID=2778364 RepID=UPI001C68A45C|nr:hypothetical protein [Ktedonospora formicarum]
MERFHCGMSRFVGSTFVLRGSERSLPGCPCQTLAPGQRAVASTGSGSTSPALFMGMILLSGFSLVFWVETAQTWLVRKLCCLTLTSLRRSYDV